MEMFDLVQRAHTSMMELQGKHIAIPELERAKKSQCGCGKNDWSCGMAQPQSWLIQTPQIIIYCKSCRNMVKMVEAAA